MKNDKKEAPKTSGDAKGKASFDQNGQGSAPKYGQAGEKPNESGEKVKKRTS
jgi:hypothetical protein